MNEGKNIRKYLCKFKNIKMFLQYILGRTGIMRRISLKDREVVQNLDEEILKGELKQVTQELNRVIINLNQVTENDLIDCLIYELNATQIRYKFILNKVKNMQSFQKDKA